MPKEFRKRGKRTKKNAAPDVPERRRPEPHVVDKPPHQEEEQEQGPSWIVQAPDHNVEINPSAPFGELDPDVKAYFRNVDTQLRDWQDSEGDGAASEPNEERRMFVEAALREMAEKELQLATDPESSIVLERLLYSMDDFVRRVFMDSMSGSYESLFKNRFASHVCQTLFDVAGDSVAREARGELPPVGASSDEGELRTVTQLTVDIAEEIMPNLNQLILNPFASHVVRALLHLLSPLQSAARDMRSKRSAQWKAKQGQMKSVYADEKGKAREETQPTRPDEFSQCARRCIIHLRETMDDNEVRALVSNKVASPCLQAILEVEANLGMSDEPDSLMDRITVGLVSETKQDSGSRPEASDYLGLLLRDQTASHLLEILVIRCPQATFDAFWDIYVVGKFAKLACHPAANFVVAKALERCGPQQVERALKELKGSYRRLIEMSHAIVLRALVDRAAALHAGETACTEGICEAFAVSDSPEDRAMFVPCVLQLETPVSVRNPTEQSVSHPRRRGGNDKEADPIKIQGALLLQSLLQLSDPHNRVVVDSLTALPLDERLKIAHHPTSSRVIDAIFESPSVSPKVKREYTLTWLDHLPALVDDRIGSRVAERLFISADTYLKEKIARAALPHENMLAGSFYGKFFVRKLNLALLKRKPDEWRDAQSTQRPKPAVKEATLPVSATKPAARVTPTYTKDADKAKKRRRPDNEIDELFTASLGKRSKTARIEVADDVQVAFNGTAKADKELSAIFGAIQQAPKGDGGRKKRKGAKS
ncbi:armadillo-type protein [Schizophyllum amplum]|uniref:Nucleolar protein 9 n=1 Tax=Schizophyllum amplum TaxID=97359 RepID=A0A550CUR4_9AGAR|nr:armadillo-type protein [Auriculariopsis ampla]